MFKYGYTELPDVTHPDWERLNRILILWFFIMLINIIFAVLIAVYALCSIISVLILWRLVVEL
jgi:heme/copper-type cytochrome/quinol oxidase subunit 3